MLLRTLQATSRRSWARQSLYSTRYAPSSLNNISVLATRTYSSTVHENDPEILEKEKRRNLSGTQQETSSPHDHAPGWNEYIATTSEAHVKADKSNDTVEEMTTRTVQHIKKRHAEESQAGVTEERGHISEEADYDREQLAGPLSSRAVGKEDSAIHKANKGNTASEDAVKADRGEH